MEVILDVVFCFCFFGKKWTLFQMLQCAFFFFSFMFAQILLLKLIWVFKALDSWFVRFFSAWNIHYFFGCIIFKNKKMIFKMLIYLKRVYSICWILILCILFIVDVKCIWYYDLLSQFNQCLYWKEGVKSFPNRRR